VRKKASHRNNSERRFRVLRINGENAPIKLVNANDKLNIGTSCAIWLNDQCEDYQCDFSWSRNIHLWYLWVGKNHALRSSPETREHLPRSWDEKESISTRWFLLFCCHCPYWTYSTLHSQHHSSHRATQQFQITSTMSSNILITGAAGYVYISPNFTNTSKR